MGTDSLLALFAEALHVPTSELNEETSPKNCNQWDSLAGMTLVTLFEDEFDIEFSTAEMMEMNSVAAVRAILKKKGVADL